MSQIEPLLEGIRNGYFVARNNKKGGEQRNSFYRWCEKNDKVFIAFEVARKYAGLTLDTDPLTKLKMCLTEEAQILIWNRIRADINPRKKGTQSPCLAWWIIDGIDIDRINSLGRDLVQMLNDRANYTDLKY